MKTKLLMICVLICTLISGCKEDDIRAPYGSGGEGLPNDVSNITVKNISGGAVLKYSVPDDPNLLYVKAVFESKQGEVREVRSSMYIDSLVIKGIGDTNERNVTVYAVNRVEEASNGVSVMIQPETPAVMKIHESLDASVDWGGFQLSFVNNDKEPVSVMVYYANEDTDGFVLHDTYYTEQAKGPLAVRGLMDKPSSFEVRIRDRWDNTSETYAFDLTPLKEELFNSVNYMEMLITGDVSWASFGGRWDCLFNDNYSAYDFAHTDYPLPFPHATTVDMGATVMLSRMKIWQRLEEADFYKHGCPRLFQMYGCPADQDPYNEANYILLMDTSLEKPSGGDFTDPNTAEDIMAAREGHEFLFKNELMQPVRYVRFVSLSSWSGMECTRITEMKFWGQYVD